MAGFSQGLSGLIAASVQLEVISNNIANVNTVGFKPSQVLFSDVYANALSGGSAGQVGIGTSTSIKQQFIQGNITPSGNPLDIAINGNGFFQLSTNGSISYTRNGQFELSPDGSIVTASGAHLQGYLAGSNGVINTGTVTDLSIDTSNLAPKATAAINTNLNLDAGAPVKTASFDPQQPSTYNYSTSVSVYDSLGNSHSLQTYYVNKGIVGSDTQWEVFATIDGQLVGGAPATPFGTLAFASDGSLNSAATFSLPITLTNGATSPQNVTIAYTGSTQFGAPSGVNAQSQDGYTSGQLTNFNTGKDGIITGIYSNGQTQPLGQLVLTSFANPSGLIPIGNNLFLPSSQSGEPIVGVPQSGNLGTLQSSAVEDSAADLTKSLVEMITAQQAYQANAQSIKTQNQLAQTLVTLKN